MLSFSTFAVLSNMYKVIFLVSALWIRTCDSAPKIGLLSSHCQSSQHHYVRDHVDCSIFYVCYRGRAWKMRCSPGTVWSTRYKVCVWDSSAYDDCLQESENELPGPPLQKQRLPPGPTNKIPEKEKATRPPIRWGRPIYTPKPPRRKTMAPVKEKVTLPAAKKTTQARTTKPIFFPWTPRPISPRPPQRTKQTTQKTTTTAKRTTTTTQQTTPTTRRFRPTAQWPRRTKQWQRRTRRPRTRRPWYRVTKKRTRPTQVPRTTEIPRRSSQAPRRTTRGSWLSTRKRSPVTIYTRPTSQKPLVKRTRPFTQRPTTVKIRRTRPVTRRSLRTTKQTIPTTKRTTPPKKLTWPTTKMFWPTTRRPTTSTTKKRTTKRPVFQRRTPRPTEPTTLRSRRPTTTPSSIYTKPTWNFWSRRVTRRPVTRKTRRPRPTRRTTTVRTTTLPTTSTTRTTPAPTTTTTTRRPTTTPKPTTTTQRPTSRRTKRTYPPWRYPPDQCGVVASTMIIGGRPSGPGRWPWQVSMQIIAAADPWHRCGGVLVDPLWVLTAAHCVEGPFYGNARNWRVVLSEDDLTYSSGREVYRRISRIVSHPGYLRASNFPNDIALLQLDDPVDVTGRYVRHACLPDRAFTLGEDWNCWISGWGETRGTSRRYVLNELEVPILDNKNCSNMWSRVSIPVLPTQVCVGNGEMGACYGDSGGPLMCEVDGVYVLGGVMSWLINNCTARNFPNVFTRVSSYIDWIYYNMDVYNFRRYS